MRLSDLADEIALDTLEREQHAANLERAILAGHVKRDLADVRMMRLRHPRARAGRAAKAIGAGEFAVKADGLVYVIERGVVVTILSDHMRVRYGARRR
jgi:hypothetical protein